MSSAMKNFNLLTPEEKTTYQRYMDETYPHLESLIGADGEIYLWMKRKDYIRIDGEQRQCRAKEGITSMAGLNARHLKDKDIMQQLSDLDAAGETILKHPDKYFWCTSCNKLHLQKELQSTVFNSYYCKSCYEADEGIREWVKDSKKSGFYD